MINMMNNVRELIRKVKDNEPMGYYLYAIIDTMGGIAYVGSTQNLYNTIDNIEDNEDVSTIFKANEWESIIALDVEELLEVCNICTEDNEEEEHYYTKLEHMEMLDYILNEENNPTLDNSKWLTSSYKNYYKCVDYCKTLGISTFVNLCELVDIYKDYSLWEVYQENDNI